MSEEHIDRMFPPAVDRLLKQLQNEKFQFFALYVKSAPITTEERDRLASIRKLRRQIAMNCIRMTIMRVKSLSTMLGHVNLNQRDKQLLKFTIDNIERELRHLGQEIYKNIHVEYDSITAKLIDEGRLDVE